MSQAVKEIVALVVDLGRSIDLPREHYKVMWLEQDDATHASSRFEDYTEASFQLYETQESDDYEQMQSLPAVLAFLSIASKFADEQGKQTPMFPREGSSLARQLMWRYFTAVGSFKLEEAILTKMCEEYYEDLEGPTAVVSSTFQITDFEAEAEFDLSEGIKFRRLNMDDIKRFGRVYQSGIAGMIQPFTSDRRLNLKDWICVAEQTSLKNTMEVINSHRNLGDDIAAALSLAASGRSAFTMLANKWKSPYMDMGVMSSGNPFFSTGQAGQVFLNESGIHDFQEAYSAIREISEGSELQYLKLPLRRLRSASSRSNNEDHIVDFVVGMESLLTDDTESLESTFRFRLRGASLLSSAHGTAREKIDLMNKIYDLRSRVVHGNAMDAEVKAMAPQVETVFKEILRWYINRSKPIGDSKAVVRKIDEMFVESGSNWAHGC
ncbi:MAG: hypothetical protein HQ475_09585 [SAR202 cluster bacterium]|nr:hypothetical protein [SAR202 cluster bacterium]